MHSTTQLLSTSQAARIAGLSPNALARAARSGRITPVAKMPGLTGAYVFERDEVERFVQAHLQPEPVSA